MKGCYSKGGKIRPKTIHGLRTGQHNNPHVLRAARANGGRCDATHVDGDKPSMRMDRPMRASGGRVKKEDGGSTISEDSKREVSKQRSEASKQNLMYGLSGAAALGSGALAAATKFNRAGNAAISGFNAMMAKDSRDKREAASSEADRIEKGLVTPGQEDRKSGGRVKKRANGGGNWIAGATKNKGALHRALKVPAGEKIPEKKLEKAEHSDNPTMRKRAELAKTLKGMKK